MTLEHVMLSAAHWAEMREAGSHQEAMEAIEAFHSAILSYGRAERERAAKVCDPTEDIGSHEYTFVRRHLSAAIRSLPDEEQSA